MILSQMLITFCLVSTPGNDIRASDCYPVMVTYPGNVEECRKAGKEIVGDIQMLGHPGDVSVYKVMAADCAEWGGSNAPNPVPTDPNGNREKET